jgi:hypothetical protein
VDRVEGLNDHPSLPKNLYEIPETAEQKMKASRGVVEGKMIRERVGWTKNKWGLVLIEPRPSMFPRDGRTVLEKAQDRKKKINLEGHQGMEKSSNPFSALSIPEISDIADKIGVNLACSKTDTARFRV